MPEMGKELFSHLIVAHGAGHYFRLGSMTTAERNALAPETGMLIWNTTTGQIEQYDGANWVGVGLGVHGAAQHTDITRTVFLPANEGFVKTGTPEDKSYAAAVEGGANLNEPFVFFTMKVPDDFVSFTKVEAIWVSDGAAGNMWWKIIASYGREGESYATHTDTPATGITATGGAGILNVQEPANPLTLANLALGDYLGLHFKREGTHANDTLDANMDLFGLLFTYVANQ